jgi:hemoglobin
MNQTPLYDLLGGEGGIRALTTRFYELMEADPAAKEIRDLHPRDLQSSEQKLFEFLSGWSGGPQLFVQKYGHPRLRARHLPFPIGIRERDQWMLCMRKALSEVIQDDTLRERLDGQFAHLADFMRNTEER